MRKEEERLFRTGEFAERTGVTKRTLRYYDRLDLLKPSHLSESGQRLYSEQDFIRLQQIVTLKFVGFSLEQIKLLLESDDLDLAGLLAMQREWMEGRLQHLQLAIQAVKEAERTLQQGTTDYSEKFQRIIGVIEMQTSRNWLDEFIEAAVSGHEETAKAVLAANPYLRQANIYTASILGEIETVRMMVEQDPALAVQQGGPKNWEPLLYLSFSCFLKDPRYSEQLARTAQMLLENGANPNAFYVQEDDPYERKLPVLYGAAGVANNAFVTRVLLEAGANPNDGESLYHAAEFSDQACLDLLYEFGVDVNATPAFFHKLDSDDEDGARWFLEHGVDPNLTLGSQENRPLHWAIYRGRSTAVIEQLIRYGADVNARRMDGKTPYMLAIRYGLTEAAELLLRHGATDVINQMDRFLGLCAVADETGIRTMQTSNPTLLSELSEEDQLMIIDFAQLNKAESIRLMIRAGFDIAVKTNEGTALHHAAWMGHIESVRVLIELGAPLTIRNIFGGTPLGSAIHGSIHCRRIGAQHADVVEALILAGSAVPEKASGSREVYDVLRRYGAGD